MGAVRHLRADRAAAGAARPVARPAGHALGAGRPGLPLDVLDHVHRRHVPGVGGALAGRAGRGRAGHGPQAEPDRVVGRAVRPGRARARRQRHDRARQPRRARLGRGPAAGLAGPRGHRGRDRPRRAGGISAQGRARRGFRPPDPAPAAARGRPAHRVGRPRRQPVAGAAPVRRAGRGPGAGSALCHRSGVRRDGDVGPARARPRAGGRGADLFRVRAGRRRPDGRPVRPARLAGAQDPLSQIESAWSETRHPAEVGGWGIRGLPGSSTIMLRGGECLVIRYRSGGRLAISIDDAERGASLINALIAERVEQ